MTTWLRTTLALFALLTLCGPQTQAQTTVQGSIRSGGLRRDYRLYVPAAYRPTTAVPLLFNLHGYGSNNLEQENYGDFRAIADTANFLVVHPNGVADGSGTRSWNTFAPPGPGIDDVAFLSALIDSLKLTYNIDNDRIYSTGMSNGGFMSYELAGRLSGRIAAVASVTGSIVQSRLNAFAPQHPMPILEIHGTADGTVPYNGNFLFLPIPTVLNYWVQFNGCLPTPVVTPVPDTNTTDGSTAERSVWSGGRNGSVVEHYRIIGGGHTWPGSAFTTGVTNRDISASREVWRFVRRFRLSRLSTPLATASATPTITPASYPNPFTTRLMLPAGTNLRPGHLSVTDARGRRMPVVVQAAGGGSFYIPTGAWAAGIYLLRTEMNGKVYAQKVAKQ
ncbi:polyhydroxybutyrate depolymerase [Hymenobacter daecheongensis DSM 21074]|uniref:Polyhydroxybutyrate depolymerase n=1 Tax=Hymenobacter daecheongensis DSM 21074 TaxID=1121955 RepID=A0A1M6H036_9BACT|nr:PHB depolymerase family esterase [Hymenobacter daecheongensis]SHJ15558.1 polyhydroxybutyrate depolymerase [Hymenobacter daecheongensis DSM 21074]